MRERRAYTELEIKILACRGHLLTGSIAKMFNVTYQKVYQLFNREAEIRNYPDYYEGDISIFKTIIPRK